MLSQSFKYVKINIIIIIIQLKLKQHTFRIKAGISNGRLDAKILRTIRKIVWRNMFKGLAVLKAPIEGK